MIARPWLVPRDESTAGYIFGRALGEYQIGGRKYYSIRRHEELRRKDYLPPDDATLKPFPIIQWNYCQLLGLDPGDLLQDFHYEENRRREDAEVDNSFAALPEEMPVKEKVWRAYQDYWIKKYPPACQEFLDFVRERYFS